MSGQPPRIETWLLERLGPRNGSALLGDLREEWHRGRWRVWHHWRQALTAISVNVFRDARVHPLLTSNHCPRTLRRYTAASLKAKKPKPVEKTAKRRDTCGRIHACIRTIGP